MRRILIAGVLVVSTLATLGCCSTVEATKKAAQGTIRDLRIIRAEVITQIPNAEIQIGGKTWTAHGLWDNRLGAMIVRERSIVAGLDGDRAFDTAQASSEEGVTQEPR